MKRDKLLLIVAMLANLLGNGYAVGYASPGWTILKVVAFVLGQSGMIICFLYAFRKAPES